MTPAEAIQRIHRNPDALTNIEAKIRGRWSCLATVGVREVFTDSDLREYISGPDVYFSLGSIHAGERCKWKSRITGKPVYSRKFLTNLNAICVDLDHDRESAATFQFEPFIQEVMQSALESGLPLPSIVINSGNGAWMLWLLRDLYSDEPLKAYDNLKAIVKRISRAAITRFKPFGADAHCSDAQRVARIPGSVHSSSGRHVAFYLVNDRTFTIPEIAGYFDVRARATEIKMHSGEKSQQHIPGGRARWKIPLDGLRKLATMRGTFSKGTRHNAVYLFAILCRRTRTKNIEHQVTRFAEAHCPTLTLEDIDRCMSSSRKAAFPIRNSTFIDMLRIQAKEQAELSNWFRSKQPSCKTRQEYRRKLIAAEMALAGGKVSIRGMLKIMASKHSMKIGRGTVERDMWEIERRAQLATVPKKPVQRLQAVSNA